MKEYIAALHLMGIEYVPGIDHYKIPSIAANKFFIRIFKTNNIIMLHTCAKEYTYHTDKESMHYIVKCIMYVLQTILNNEKKEKQNVQI